MMQADIRSFLPPLRPVQHGPVGSLSSVEAPGSQELEIALQQLSSPASSPPQSIYTSQEILSLQTNSIVSDQDIEQH